MHRETDLATAARLTGGSVRVIRRLIAEGKIRPPRSGLDPDDYVFDSGLLAELKGLLIIEVTRSRRPGRTEMYLSAGGSRVTA